MSSQTIDVPAVFTDTSVLYDYSKDQLPEAKQFFEGYTDLEKVTSTFGHQEYTNVAERRAEAYRAWEQAVADDEDTIGDYTFTTPDSLRPKDLDILREFQRELVEECGEVEALRRINNRVRQYENGVKLLFGDLGGDPLVEVVSINARDELIEALKLDIQNHNDRRLLAEAAEWHDSTGTDTFVTSDKDDFQSDGGQSGPSTSSSSGLPATLEALGRAGGSLQDDVNQHISRIYSNIDHLWIEQLIDFVETYQP